MIVDVPKVETIGTVTRSLPESIGQMPCPRRGVTPRRSFRLTAKAVVGSLALSVAVGGLMLLIQPKLREWVYRETSYRFILDSILNSLPASHEPIAVTTAIADYVHEQTYPGGDVVVDTDSWTHLVRGIGWCDQKGWTIGTLLALQGIHSRLVMLRDKRGVVRHTVLEVFLNGPLTGTLP